MWIASREWVKCGFVDFVILVSLLVRGRRIFRLLFAHGLGVGHFSLGFLESRSGTAMFLRIVFDQMR